MFQMIQSASYDFTPLPDSPDHTFLKATDQRNRNCLFLKRHKTDSRKTIEEFQIHKSASRITSQVVCAYQLLAVQGKTYFTTEWMEESITHTIEVWNRNERTQAEEDLWVHGLLKLMIGVAELHAAGIVNSNISQTNVWKSSGDTYKLGGFYKAQQYPDPITLFHASKQDSKSLGLLLVSCITTGHLALDAQESDCREALQQRFSLSKRYSHLAVLAEMLVKDDPRDRLTVTQAIGLYPALKLNSESVFQALSETIRNAQLLLLCKVCRIRKSLSDFTYYPCPKQHFSCSLCFDASAKFLSERKEVFDPADFACPMCSDSELDPKRFVSLVKDEGIRERLSQRVERELYAKCPKCKLELGIKAKLPTKMNCGNCGKTVRIHSLMIHNSPVHRN